MLDYLLKQINCTVGMLVNYFIIASFVAVEAIFCFIGKNSPNFVFNEYNSYKYTIITPSYHKRIDFLKRQLELLVYEDLPHLEEIFIVWDDLEVPLPNLQTYGIDEKKQKVKVTFLPPTTGFVTDRFIIPENIKTRAILSLDDDLAIKGKDIEIMFDVYKKNKLESSMFGNLKRRIKDGVYIANTIIDYYSLTLTNIAFLDISMLYNYNSEKNKKYVDYVIEVRNCEDILMAASTYKTFGSLPMTMNIPTDEFPHEGFSSQNDHNIKRGKCGSYFEKEMNFTFDSIRQQYSFTANGRLYKI